MGAPQLITIGLICVGLGLSIAQHGQDKKGKENFWVTLFATGVNIGLLYWGGFFG